MMHRLLTRIFTVCVTYREFSATAGLSCIQFPQPEDGVGSDGAGLCFFTVQLLYRPGHYDILYSS
jgi:hypothetical protein